MTVRIISYGGGIQSTALLVLATQGKLDKILGGSVDAAVIANVGDDSEHPATLKYLAEFAVPFGAENGVPVIEIKRSYVRTGIAYPTLREACMNPDTSDIPIPVFQVGSGPARRNCTSKWKIEPIARWVKDRGATVEDPALVCIGISVDEIERAQRGRNETHERKMYPLLDLGLNRTDCARIIEAAGLPVPPRSAWYFCPFHRVSGWAERRRDEPELFALAEELEDAINAKRLARDKEPVYLTAKGKRLSESVTAAQDSLFSGGPEECDSGYCWT